MSKALIVTGANFTANALTTITLSDPVPCTGITLSQNSISTTSLGDAGTLTATVAPIDTTDTVSWSSSNENVATVSNGVVTTVGVGTATITATCGNYSASCTVTSTAFMLYTGVTDTYPSGNPTYSGASGIARLNYNEDSYNIRATLVASSGTLSFYNQTNGVWYYPYKMPKNTARLKVTTPTGSNGCKVSRGLFFSTTVCTEGYSTTAQCIDQFGTLEPTAGVTMIDVPSYEGFPDIDGVAINLVMNNGTSEFLEEYLNDVTVEFLPAA